MVCTVFVFGLFKGTLDRTWSYNLLLYVCLDQRRQGSTVGQLVVCILSPVLSNRSTVDWCLRIRTDRLSSCWPVWCIYRVRWVVYHSIHLPTGNTISQILDNKFKPDTGRRHVGESIHTDVKISTFFFFLHVVSTFHEVFRISQMIQQEMSFTNDWSHNSVIQNPNQTICRFHRQCVDEGSFLQSLIRKECLSQSWIS